MLTNPSGFAGIDGLFRFRSDGTNERGLAVMRVGIGGGVAGRGIAEEFWRVTSRRPGLERTRNPGVAVETEDQATSATNIDDTAYGSRLKAGRRI